jgi:hypothetical protein
MDLESDDFSENVYLSISYSKQVLGAAVYSNHILSMMNHFQTTDYENVINLLRIQTNPTHILVSARSDPEFLQLLSHPIDFIQSSKIEIRPSTDYKFKIALQQAKKYLTRF